MDRDIGERASFRDSAGRPWQLTLTLGLVRRLRDELGLDFGAVHDGKVFLRMAADPYLFGAALYAICESQAMQRQVSAEQFGESLTGESGDAAFQALLEAVVNFTRAPMRTAVEKILFGAMATLEKGLNRVADQSLAQIPKVLDQVEQAATDGWRDHFGKS